MAWRCGESMYISNLIALRYPARDSRENSNIDDLLHGHPFIGPTYPRPLVRYRRHITLTLGTLTTSLGKTEFPIDTKVHLKSVTGGMLAEIAYNVQQS